MIDNLLSDEALARLRRFCWGSTVWRKVYRDGYLGAMPEHGFACPLLAQIADELRSTYPAILGQYPLLRLWGFKYDSRLTGINIHADFVLGVLLKQAWTANNIREYNKNYERVKPKFILCYLTHHLKIDKWSFSFWEGDKIGPDDVMRVKQKLDATFDGHADLP